MDCSTKLKEFHRIIRLIRRHGRYVPCLFGRVFVNPVDGDTRDLDDVSDATGDQASRAAVSTFQKNVLLKMLLPLVNLPRLSLLRPLGSAILNLLSNPLLMAYPLRIS